jgi:hypothetical protein
MIKLTILLNEIEINKPINLKNFSSIIRLLKIIKDDMERGGDDFEERTAITNIDDIGIYHANGETLDDEDRAENLIEIWVTPKDNQGGCEGVVISNMGQDYWEKISSGTSFETIPDVKYHGNPLYYDIMWC